MGRKIRLIKSKEKSDNDIVYRPLEPSEDWVEEAAKAYKEEELERERAERKHSEVVHAEKEHGENVHAVKEHVVKEHTVQEHSEKSHTGRNYFYGISDYEDSELRRAERKRVGRIVMVVCAVVFTVLLALSVGCGLALWDMEKTPGDLMAAISGKDLIASNGDMDRSAGGLTFIDPEEESAGGSALTFIDANEEPDGGEDSSEGGEAEIGDGGILDSEADSVTIAKDGSVIVSSELSGVHSIVKAGTNEVLTTVTAAQASMRDPNEGYPLPFTAVDDSYFDDALFIGDSRFYGFMMWSGIPGANYCATSFNIFQYETFKVVQTGNGKVPIFNVLPYNAFSKIYIKVGLNEMGSSEEKFEAKYAELIAKLREMEPRAIIYIHAVLPVTAAKSASDGTHNNPKIIARNASLKQFAIQQQCYFIDAGPVLSDESGCLRPEMTSDGIHLASRYMGVWKQYLMENAVVVPDSGNDDAAASDDSNPADGNQVEEHDESASSEENADSGSE